MFILPLTCGVRYNELINIRWRDLHIDRGNMDITVAKGGTSRKAQLPKFIQKFLEDVKKNRVSGILPGDYLFTGYDRNRDISIYKSIIKEITGEDCNDMASNCLRRSGCNLIEKFRHGLGDLQLGHSTCTRLTQRSYIDGDDYQEVNDFWDDFYRECMSPKPILHLSTSRELTENPRQTQYIHLDTEAG
jgi:integrase